MKFFFMTISVEFWPNCNQTADKKANIKNISHFSKYLIGIGSFGNLLPS